MEYEVWQNDAFYALPIIDGALWSYTIVSKTTGLLLACVTKDAVCFFGTNPVVKAQLFDYCNYVRYMFGLTN